MQGKWDTFLQGLGKAGQGPLELKPMRRGFGYTVTLGFKYDLSSDTISASINNSPDGVGAGVAFAVTIGSFSNGETPVTLELTSAQVDSLTADADGDGSEVFVWDMTRQPIGGSEYPILGGTIELLGNITDAA